MRKPIRIKLQNGLDAVLHTPRSTQMAKIVKQYREQLYLKHSLLYAVEVTIENETLYVIYWTTFRNRNEILPKLEVSLEYALQYNSFILYEGTAYSITSPVNKTLVNAIINKIKPSIATLVTP